MPTEQERGRIQINRISARRIAVAGSNFLLRELQIRGLVLVRTNGRQSNRWLNSALKTRSDGERGSAVIFRSVLLLNASMLQRDLVRLDCFCIFSFAEVHRHTKIVLVRVSATSALVCFLILTCNVAAQRSGRKQSRYTRMTVPQVRQEIHSTAS